MKVRKSLNLTRLPFSSFPRQNAGAKIKGIITVDPKHVRKCCAPNNMHIYHGGTKIVFHYASRFRCVLSKDIDFVSQQLEFQVYRV